MADFSKEFLIRVRADIEKAVKDMKRLTGEMKGQSKAAKAEQAQVSGLSKGFTRLAAAASAYVTVQTALKALRMADEYRQIQFQLQQATKATGDYVKVSESLFRISQRNGTALESTVRLFRGVARSARNLGASVEDALAITAAIQQLTAMGGTSGAQLSGAMVQLSQLFAGTVVQAEEFNSLIDAAPELVQAIADGMGITYTQLLLSVKAGKVLVSEVFGALQKQAPEIAKRMADVPDSIDKGGQRLSNSMTKFLFQLDQAISSSAIVQATMNNASANLDAMSDSLEEQYGLGARLNDLQMERLRVLKNIKRIQEGIARLESIQDLSPVGQRLLKARRFGLEQDQKLIEKIDAQLVELNEKALKLSRTEQTAGTAATESQKALANSLQDVNTQLARQIELFEAQAEQAVNARDRVAELATSFDTAAAEINKAAAKTSKTPGLDIQQQILTARRALSGGDLAGAISGVEDARDLIVEVARAGGESRTVLNFLLKQAKTIGLQAAQALAEQEQARLKQIETILVALKTKAKELESLKVGFDQEAASQAATTLRTNLQTEFSNNPLIIPVIMQSAGTEQSTQSHAKAAEGLAAGGLLRGPGTGTSDSILARLSNGEYVMRRRAVDHYGTHALDQINAMSLPRFAEGGLAELSRSILANSSASQPKGQPINLYLDGQRFEVSAGDDVVDRMMRTFGREALKRGGRI